MADSTQTPRFRLWRSLVRFIGVVVPRRFRARLMILGESLSYTLLGVIVGLAGAFGLTRLLSNLL